MPGTLLLAVLLLAPAPARSTDPSAVEAALARQDCVEAFALAVCELRVVARSHDERDPVTLAALLEVGRVAHLGGRKELAVELLERALAGWRSLDPPPRAELARTLRWLGSCRRHLSLRDEAWSCYEEALALLDGHPELAEARADLLGIRAQWLRGRGYGHALPALEDALRAQRALGDEPRLALAEALTWLSWARVRDGDPRGATSGAVEAQRMLDRLALPQHELHGVLASLRGVTASLEHRAQAAADAFHEAGLRFERGRDGCLPVYPRTRLQLGDYCSEAGALLELGRPEAAWSALQRGRMGAAEDFVVLASWPRVEPEGFERVRALRRAKLALLDDEPTWPGLLDELELLALTWTAEADYLRRHALEVPTPAEVARTLRPNAAYLGFLDLAHGAEPGLEREAKRGATWAFVLRPERGLRWVRLDEWRGAAACAAARRDRQALQRALRCASEWPLHVERDPELEGAARRLGRRLFDPLEGLLDGVEEIVWEGAGEYLPLGLLRDASGRYLEERYTIGSVSSAAAHVALHAREARPLEPFLVLAGASEESEGSLPHALHEIRAALAAHAGESLRLERGGGFARILAAALADELGDYGLVHLVGHAISDVSLSRCGFQLGDDAAGGSLQAEVVLDSWRLDSPLVVLSGCSTNGGAGRSRGEAFGLVQVMLGVGARAVVASSWPVEDEATSLLMEEFYRRLACEGPARAPGSIPRALRDAKRWLMQLERDGRRPFAHPVYWAGFRSIGATD